MKTIKSKSKLIAAILCTALVFTFSAGSLAAAAIESTSDTPTVTLGETSGTPVFTFNRVDTDLFDGFKDVMPGDVLTQAITVKTPSGLGYAYDIYLSAARPAALQPQSRMDEPVDFFDLLTLVVKDGTTELDIMNAASGTGGVYLGRFSRSGTSKDLTVTLTVPTTMGNEFANALAEIDWTFYAQRVERPVDPTDPTDPTNPTSPTQPTTEPEEEVTTETPLGPTEPGTTEPGEFIDEDPTPLDDMPKTGFQSTLALWAVLSVISGGLLVYLLLGLKPRKQ